MLEQRHKNQMKTSNEGADATNSETYVKYVPGFGPPTYSTLM